jgi:DNA polymerase III subunit alpha
MTEPGFVHLRVHTAYSLSQGAAQIPALVKRAAEYGMPALGIADTGNLFGALEFSVAAAKAGIQPIIGCVLPILAPDTQPGKRGGIDKLPVLVQSEAGYRNLSRLSSRGFLQPADETTAPSLSIANLEGMTDGLLALTGGPTGGLGRLLLEGQKPAALSYLDRLETLFAGRLYIEIMRHGLENERRLEPMLLELAYARNLPLVATNEVYFLDPETRDAHEVLLCIADGATIGRPDRRRSSSEYRLKSIGEMRELFADLPEAADNTIAIARRSAFMVETREPILPRFESASGRSEEQEIRAQAEAGLERRLQVRDFRADLPLPDRAALAPAYRQRLAFELDVIVKMGFAGYFLIVADFIQWAKSQGIPVGPGRGSGAGSLVAWSLTITDLDPLRFGLLFERFLNPERVSMPDFDIDFCQDRRDEVIEYVCAKYGTDRVAQIITFGKLQARAAIRDVGRVLEMPYGQVDRISKLVPHNPANPVSLAQAIEAEPQLAQMRDQDETVARLLDTALILEGLYRHASTHAAGVVIGDRPLEDLVPLYRDPRAALPATQFNMKYVEQAGLVKFDFLGLTTLTVIEEAIRLLRRREIEIDIASIPLDDRKSYEMLARAEAVGVFQFESSGMRNLLRDAYPSNIEDLIALVALYRPGPMENIPKYVACKRGREAPEFLHETIVPVVKDTYGVIIYQEQVMQIAQVFAGFTLGQADLLRRAMGKKIKSEMQAQRQNFIAGAIQRGVDADRAAYVFDLVDRFAGYGFNKAHSAGYALVAYQTAWLKANYPVEFLAASMTYSMSSTDKLGQFRREADRMGIAVLPPDINRSDPSFTVERMPDQSLAIRYALAALKGVGRQVMEQVRSAREAGPFRDLGDFAARTATGLLNKRQIEALARAGAFDALLPNRKRITEGAEAILRHGQRFAEEQISQQSNLFGEGVANSPALALPEVVDWAPLDRLQQEFDAIGVFLSAHPLDSYQESLARLDVIPAAELPAQVAAGRTRVKLAGTIVAKQERTGRSGGRYAIVQMSDPSGLFEIWVFSEALAAARELLETGKSVLATAEARLDGENVRLTAQSLVSLDQTVAEAGGNLGIVIRDMAPLEPLRAILKRGARGKGRLALVLDLGTGTEARIAVPGGFALSAAVRAEIQAVPGVIELRDG